MSSGVQGSPVTGPFGAALRSARMWFSEFRLAINARIGGGQRIPTFRESIPNLAPLAVLALLFAGNEIYQRAVVELSGTVTLSETTCVQPYNNRCSTKYVVTGENGSYATYVAGSSDASLERYLPVGTLVNKRKWSLVYSVNGKQISDFPIKFYDGVILVGMLCAWSGALSFKGPSK